MSSAAASPSRTTITVSVRECRIIAERVLIVAGVPLGAVPPIRDAVIDAELLGLGGMAHLRDDLERLWPADVSPLRYREIASGILDVDCGNRSGLIVAPDIMDLAVAFGHRHGGAVLKLASLFRPQLLMALAVSAHLHDVAL